DPQVEAHQHRGFISHHLERFNRWFERMADRYKSVIGWALDHRTAMIGLAFVTFAASLLLVVTGKVGAEFVPVSDRSEVDFIVETPPGSNLEYTRLKAEEAARIARSHKEVSYTYTTVGTPLVGKAPGVDHALIYVRLVPKADRALSQDQIGNILRGELLRIGGARVSVFTSGFGGAMKQIQVQFRGPDASALTTFAEQVASETEKVAGAVDVGLSTRGQMPELEVQLNRPLAGSLGITVGQV